MFKKLFLITVFYCISLKGSMELISPAFLNHESIPIQYTCDGANISPALIWSNAPQNTKSFTLIVDDPDAPAKVWVHWILFNIPATTNQIHENTSHDSFLQGATDFNGKQQWGGPCPPSGIHRYQFTLYALDTQLNLPAGTNKDKIIKAMHGHILEQTTLIGTYQRKK
ncbi:MAG TPA: YbhB/YbcL family Raf kinase inhibitor-like protein [Candidatus Babeliales bacterium]|nr:YbhB/YbcL family Raf kinase inhibitor-like protein [Candidatus Babeliales bacterium]